MRRLPSILWLCLAAACVNRDIVKPPEAGALTSEEIVAGLGSSNFREVLRARSQLAGLPDEAWLAVLAPFASDEVPARRLVAAVELAHRPYGFARTLLARLALDADETVRNEASERLASAPLPGGAP